MPCSMLASKIHCSKILRSSMKQLLAEVKQRLEAAKLLLCSPQVLLKLLQQVINFSVKQSTRCNSQMICWYPKAIAPHLTWQLKNAPDRLNSSHDGYGELLLLDSLQLSLLLSLLLRLLIMIVGGVLILAS